MLNMRYFLKTFKKLPVVLIMQFSVISVLHLKNNKFTYKIISNFFSAKYEN